MEATYDGNAMAGMLAEVFTAEMTAAVGRCRGCGMSSVVAEMAVYGPSPGLVARCPGCADVLMRVVRTSQSMWLDLSGLSALRFAVSG